MTKSELTQVPSDARMWRDRIEDVRQKLCLAHLEKAEGNGSREIHGSSAHLKEYLIEAENLIRGFRSNYSQATSSFLSINGGLSISAISNLNDHDRASGVDKWTLYYFQNGWERLDKYLSSAWSRIYSRQQVQKLRSIVRLCEYQLDLPFTENSDPYQTLIRPVQILIDRCRSEEVFEIQRPIQELREGGLRNQSRSSSFSFDPIRSQDDDSKCTGQFVSTAA